MLKKDFNIKKNFLRVKQRADQGLGRAEKTEVLSSDLQNAEKKVEVLKTVVQSIIKRLTASLQAHGIQDAEKRTKKMPIVHLANSLLENSNQLVEGVLSDVFSECAHGLLIIGNAQQTYELLIEKNTLAYFQQLLDVDVPAIRKSKQILSKLTLDMDATRSRQQAANKESSLHPSTHNQTKSDTLNNDLEDAEQKVAACKDQYATEMFTFLSKESEICLRIVELMDAQLSYYRSSVTKLEDLLPEIKSMIGQHSTRPVYGCPLEEHLQTTGKEIASVIETCVSILYHSGLEEEGLFRIAGSATQLKKLKAAFNVGTLVDMDDYFSDYHVVAGALKQYIRELPEPLLTFHLFDEFLQCMSVKNRDSRLQQLWTVVNKLPKNNFDNVKYLIKFLSKLAEKSEVNKMSPGNIAIVFGPNLLWNPNDDGKPNVVLSAVQNQVVETLVTHHDYFFPGEFELFNNSVSNSDCNKTSTVKDSEGKVEVSRRPKLLHNRASSMYVSTTSSVDINDNNDSLRTNCDSSMSQSTDTISTDTTSSDTLRRKTKGTRLSFPSALNSASDKLFGKRRSNESIKSRGSVNEDCDKKDKKSLRQRFGLKTSAKEKSRSCDTDLDSGVADSPEVLQRTAPSPIGQIEFKPKYTVEDDRPDSWHTGAADAPLATAEVEESPIDPPTRSFPLCSTSLPHHVHGDMYDTAFALTSLKGDGTSTGLEYLHQVHSVANTAFISSANKSSPFHLCPQDIEFADVESVIGRQSSVGNSESEAQSHPADASNETVGSAGAQVKPAGELFVADDSSLSASQHSLASTDSGASSILSHSPSVHRKSKKPAPPPPPSFTTQTSYKESTPAKPERPERHASVKKPDVPPPGPPPGLPSGPPPSLPSGPPPNVPSGPPPSLPSGPPPSVPSGPPPGPPSDPPPSLPSLGLPIAQNHSSESSAAPPATQPTVITTSSSQSKAPSRPSNPPPPTPPATNTTSASYTPVPSANPFLDTAAVVNTTPSVARSLSDDQNTQSKKHSRNASADIPASQTAELKGHNRTKSHDLKLRQPPPIPQRTHSIPTKHSPEQKRLISASKDSSPSEPVTSEAEVKLVDVVSHSKVSNDVIQEVEAGEKEPDDEYRIRMNSVTDDTSL